MLSRPRRNRKNQAIRNLVRENRLTPHDLIAPLFVIEGNNLEIPVDSMPGVSRYSLDKLVSKAKFLYSLGVPCISIFPALDDSIKDVRATESTNRDGLYPRSIRAIKEAIPELVIMTDVAMDPYSSDGHDGLVDKATGEILNDESLDILAQMAITQAQAGSDIVGPSDMMDGRISYIRDALDDEGFSNTSIMAYTAKYASAFYGPFRDALDSAPKMGDKKSYQMDYSNSKEAVRETFLDEQEGADILMVKPGLAYLDIIKTMSETTTLPIAAYNVSGEYAMVKAASERGWIDGPQVMMETLTAFRRAGCNMILTYFAEEASILLNK